MNGPPTESEDEFADARELLRAQFTELASPADRWLSRVVSELRSRGSRTSWTSEAISALPEAESTPPEPQADRALAPARRAPDAPPSARRQTARDGIDLLLRELPRLRQELAAVAAELERLSA